RDLVDKRERIESAATALVNPLIEEHRVLVGCGSRICGNSDRCAPDSYRIICNGLRRSRTVIRHGKSTTAYRVNPAAPHKATSYGQPSYVRSGDPMPGVWFRSSAISNITEVNGLLNRSLAPLRPTKQRGRRRGRSRVRQILCR